MTEIIHADLATLGGLFSVVRPALAEEYGLEGDQEAGEVINPLAEAIKGEHSALIAAAVAVMEQVPATGLYPTWRRKLAPALPLGIEDVAAELAEFAAEEQADGSQAPQEPVAAPAPLPARRWDGTDSPLVITQSTRG